MGRQAAFTRMTPRVGGTAEGKRAVFYLRVSTPSQVNTDYNPEGISLPAQREATERKALELRAEVVDEYLEPGRTATTIDRRPVFQEMLARIKSQQDVDYVIVYHFNRIFRNSIDAAITKRELARYGVRVISTVLDMGESPESAMVETIIHAFDQYQSEASGADIKYKMGQKVKNGGTITSAPLGYLNERIDVDGRKVAVSVQDPERGPHLARGFEMYGTGQYTAQEVLDRLTAAGLRTRGRKGQPSSPLSLARFYGILADRYYTGVVEYEGEEYPGRHDALISVELFERVQRVLALHGGGGTRQRTHHHYLKGLLWCGRCGRRFVIMPGRGNGGTYFYFMCRGRQDHECDQPYLRVEAVEEAVSRHYVTVQLDADFRERLRQLLDEALLGDLGSLDRLKKRLNARLGELGAREDEYLELVGTPGWPKEKIRRKLDQIQIERDQIAEQLADTGSRLTAGREFFLAALELLRNPQAFYERAGTSLRHAMNKIVFAKLLVDGEEISDHELTDVVRDLVEAQHRIYRSGGLPAALSAKGKNANSRLPEEAAVWSGLTSADLLAMAVLGHGSSRVAMVDDTGIEPVTSSVSGKRSPAELIVREPG